MPHKVGKNWKWGNIERPTKGELVKVVYGIWQKNGAKGNFADFWETGKVSDTESKGEDVSLKEYLST